MKLNRFLWMAIALDTIILGTIALLYVRMAQEDRPISVNFIVGTVVAFLSSSLMLAVGILKQRELGKKPDSSLSKAEK